MKTMMKRLVAVLLSLCMLGSVMPLQLLAAEAPARLLQQGEQPASLITPEGEIPAEEDWDEDYPFGAFAFGTYQADLGEPGALTQDGEEFSQTALLPVYRVGGTRGRATVKITYAPAVTTDKTGTAPVYDYAASGKSDLLIEVEDPNPLAAYQEIGLPRAEREMQPAPNVGIHSELGEENSLHLSLSGAEEAEAYRWQYRGPAGGWKDVEGGAEAELDLTMDDYSALGITGWDGLDFRCILTVKDFLLCSISLDGERFVPYAAAGAIPEGLTAPEEPAYTPIEFAEDYAIYEFDLTFAEGETVKYIRVTALDDETPELPEMGLFTIVGCEGGELNDLCNTLTLMISDNDEAEPSQVGFSVTGVTVDRSEGVAYATVRREGGKTYNVTVNYETQDGTAKAGVDYAAKSGSLAFAGSIDEIVIPIELISNDETGETSFSLKLTELRGGGSEELCTLDGDTLIFTLRGESPKGEVGQNLATVLSGGDGRDASGRLSVEEGALLSGDELQKVDVRMPEPEALTAELSLSEASGTRSHEVGAKLSFSRSTGYDETYWHDWEIVAGNGTNGGSNLADASNNINYTGKWSYLLYTYVNKSMESFEFGANESETGEDKNHNTTFINHYYSKSGSSAMFSSYMELQANFLSGATHTLPKAGDLYDEAVLITYLDSVGVKKRSSNSYYIGPRILLSAIPSTVSGDNRSYSTGSSEYSITWLTGNSAAFFTHWLSSQGFKDNHWTLANPHEISSSDISGTDWPDDGIVSALPMPLGVDLMLNIEFLPYKTSGTVFTNVTDANEIAQNNGYTALDIVSYRLHRRVLTKTNEIPVIVYTANDENEAGTTWTPIDGNSSIYNDVCPKLSIAANQGGVDSSGHIYVGSTFKVNTKDMPAGYTIDSNGLFFTKSITKNGTTTTTRVGTVTRSGDEWTITLPWEGITEDDLTATYKLNVFLQRSQKIEIDFGPSVPRTNGVVNPGAAEEVSGDFLLYGCRLNWSKLSVDADGNPVPNADGKYFGETVTTRLYGDGLVKVSNTEATYVTPANFTNLQSVTFSQFPEDVIVYNGRAYKGTDTIVLTESDFGGGNVHFIYYSKDYLDAISPMYASIDHVELYYDGDGDNKISGSLDSNNLFQVSGADELVTRKLNGDYPEATFKPVVTHTYDDEGNITGTTYHQYYLKVFYNMRPRAIKMPVGASSQDRAQVLPAITTSITEGSAYADLTPEQKSFRYLAGDNTDGHIMYGYEASALDYVDIPLGGDAGTVLYSSHTEAVRDKNGKITGAETKESYTWNPHYLGSLLVPFDNPTPIIDTNNITGHSVPMAGANVALDPVAGTYDYNSNPDARDSMNRFLGAMTGRSTFAIGVQEQKTTLGNIKRMDQIDPETITMGTVSTTPNGDAVMNLTAGGEPGSTEGAGPGEDSGYPEFNADLGTEMPSLELELGDYATLIMDGYQIGFAIGIPIYKYEETNYSGSERTEKMSDGSTKESHYDEDGKYHETTTSKDGKTITNMTQETDGKDPNKRTTTTVTEVTDEKGNKTYKTVTEQQEKKTDPKTKKESWETVDKQTENTKPPAPSQAPDKTKGEKFKDGFKEANGQMQTLCDFVSACKTGKMDQLKDFFSGSFEDDSLKNAKNGNCTSTKVEVSFTVQISIMFEYNPIDNCHYFKSAGLSASLGIEVSVQHRFSAFPLAYVYVKLGAEVELAVSLSCIRNPKLGAPIKTFRQGSLEGLSSGQSLVFELNMKKTNGVKIRGFHIDLLGSVYMEIFDTPALGDDPIDAGALNGDGSEKEVLLEDYGRTVYIRLTPLRGGVVADNLRPVTGASSKVVFDGVTLTPSISLEAGVGIGIELLKFEIFVKTSVAITLTMGGYLEETDRYEGFYVSSFEWGLCVGFNVTALFFNYSMDAIGISVEGSQHGTGGIFDWHIAASAVNGDKELWSKDTFTAADGKPLGTEEPEPPDDNNIGPLDTEFGYVFGGFPNNAPWYMAQPITLTEEGLFPDDCGWVLKEHEAAWSWDGGNYRGEIPQDGDLVKATRDRVYVQFQVPAGSGEISVWFDGKIDIQCGGETRTGVRKSPVKIEVGQSAATVRLTLSKNTTLDRWAVKQEEGDDGNGAVAGTTTRGLSASLIHVTAPTDVSGTQAVARAGEDNRAIDPTGTADFQLSGFNTAGDAKKLVTGLATGYSYKLFQADGENYILYPVMQNKTTQLVMSRIVMTGDLSLVSGLEHPTDPNAENPWLKVDNDNFGDLDYNVSVNGKTVTVVWTAYRSAAADSAVESAKNVVVKQASLRLGTDAAFSAPTVLTQGVGSYRFLPAREGETTVWAEAVGNGSANNQKLAAYLIAVTDGLDMDMLTSHIVTDALLANTVYRWVVQSDLNAISGDKSRLVASNGASAVIPGQNLENIEIGQAAGRTLVLYTTTETAFFDAAQTVPGTVDAGAFTKDTELATIRRLYLRELLGSAWGEAVLLQTVVDFDGCTDDNIESRTLKDGIYVENVLHTEQPDPYYSNLSFLRADLDGSGAVETLLLFEMGGNSYLLRQSDALALLDGGEGSLLPIFTETTGTDVAIGSDGENLAVVYTAPVANSMSNAIYTAWWDRSAGDWGSPTILAMRNLQVYEDGLKYGLSPDELEQIYLGLNGMTTPDGHSGSLDKLIFSDLQMSTRTVTDDMGRENTQLLVLTMGSLQPLMEYTFNIPKCKPMDTLLPAGDADISFYAIAFGVGDQALGQGRLSLGNYDFSAGSKLVGEVSFVNTGTTAIRGSDANPILVQLCVNTGSKTQVLAQWQLTESIRSGGSVLLSFLSPPLERTLPKNSSFFVTVSEDTSYFEKPFAGEIDDLLIVEEKPDLSIPAFSAELVGFENDKAILKIRMEVQNNGNATADQVFVQFARDTGLRDEATKLPIYDDVDITGSVLETSVQMTRQQVTEDYSHGVYQLKSINGSALPLDTGNYREVTGLLYVPTSCFASLEDFSGLHLRAEAYSGLDSPDYDNGLYSSDHNEYNSTNNRAEVTVKHCTYFDVPNHITTALGTTLVLPVGIESTSANPELVLTEISDGTEGWEPRMGVCYYDPVRQVIVAAPNAKAMELLEQGVVPTGILQLRDTSTNSIAAIAYKVGSLADGVNIFKDDASFTFYNADGALTDLNAAQADNPGWLFRGWPMAAGWICGSVGEIPMNSDLSIANQDNAYLCFETVADSLTIYYMGEITVWSEPALGFTQKVFNNTVLAEGQTTAAPAVVQFNNPTGARHKVYIRAKAGTMIDRYTATYQDGAIPETDPNAPQILWNRSFPETASVESGQSVPMTCYILDGSSLQNVFFNGQPLSGTTTPKLVKVDENLWYFDYSFTQNGYYSLQAQDLSGNSSVGSVSVSWFNDVPSIGAIATAPGLVRSHLSFVDASGNTIPTTGTLTAAPFLKSAYAPASEEASTAYLFTDGVFSGDPLGKTTNERWLASRNGYYLVRVDRADGTWARAVTVLKNLDETPPAVTPGLPGKGTPDAPYRIGSRQDWLKLRSYVAGNNPTLGMCFLQTEDFVITEADMIGSSTSMFRGVYDGGGHTLTFNSANGTRECAPFWYVENATFRNLHIDGTITTAEKFAAGIVVNAYGVTNFYNCRVSMTIVSNISASNIDGTHGGLVSYTGPGSTVNITGCTVDGSFLGVTSLSAGFVGYCRGVLVMKDCLFAPAAWEWTSSQNFYRWQGDYSRSLMNCYYLETCANDQGVRGWKVQPGEHVALDFGGGTVYDVAGLTACATGLGHGDFLCAGQGETIAMMPSYTGDPEDAEPLFLASAGTFVNSKGSVWSLTMPKTDVTITMAGHEWGEPWYEWAEDDSSVTAYALCGHNESHIRKETVGTNFFLTQPSTFDTEGAGCYTASFQDPYFSPQTKQVVIPAVACGGGDSCPSKHFTDMPSVTNYAHIPIDWAVLNRITQGTSATTFGPKQTVTRAQFVTFLWGAVGKPEPGITENPFTDVKASAYYYKAVLWAVENGITTGTTATTFGPKNVCTRAQVVTFLWASQGSPEPTTTENPFTDVKPTSYYCKPVLWAVENGVTGGTTAATFSPKGNCTRAQVVTFLYKIFGQ